MDVQLSQSLHTALFSTQRIAALTARTQERISTGQKYGSLVDNAQAVSIGRSLSNRASDLLKIKDSLGQNASRLQTSISGLESIDKMLDQLKAVSLQYEATGSASVKADLSAQFDVLKQQLDGLARDSSYGGTNLIDATPDSLEIALNEDGSSTITVPGQASDATTLAVDITDIATINAAISQVRSTAQSIGSNASVIEIRENFTQDLVNSLKEGEAKLLNTDLNEEAANILSLQTRGALAAVATKIASQSERAILQLF